MTLQSLRTLLTVQMFIKCHSARWDEFGSELRVPYDTRESLRRDLTLDDRGRLERVVMKWIQSPCFPVTWQNVIDTLLSMELKTTAGEVHDWLKHQQMINKSLSKPILKSVLGHIN